MRNKHQLRGIINLFCKSLCFGLLLLLTNQSLFSQEDVIYSESLQTQDNIDINEDVSEGSDDFDLLFEDAADIEVEEATPAQSQQELKLINISGTLSSAPGIAFIINTDDFSKSKPSGYFDLSNTVSVSSNPTPNTGVHFSFSSSFPSYAFSLDTLYFDYMHKNFFLQAGKKSITWGNTKLFTCNPLSDSSDCTSISGTLAFGKISFSGIVLYNTNWNTGEAAYPSADSMAYCGKIETVIGPVNCNFLARKWATNQTDHPKPLVGLELKTTILNFDIYEHTSLNVKVVSNSNKMLSISGIEKICFTGGLYRTWENPKMGAIFEYQYNYLPDQDQIEKIHNHAIKAQFGISRLCKQHLKLAFDASYDFTNKTGNITPGGIIVLLPNADIQIGIPIDFSKDNGASKCIVGAKLALSIQYP